MPKIIHVVISALCSQLILSACGTPFALHSKMDAAGEPLRATLVTTSTGTNLRVIQVDKLPQDLRNAAKIQAILDNSTGTYPVERNADGSLSIPLPSGREPDSNGLVEILLTDGLSSWLVTFDTGPLLTLSKTPIKVEPASQVIHGTALNLSAQFDAAIKPEDYSFSWSTASSVQGPWLPISGSKAAVRWQPLQPGNYFIRLETRELATSSSSVFTSSSPLVFVEAPDSIALTEPSSGQILAGDEVVLAANIPERQTAEQFLWAYSQSPVGPFQPIAEQGARVSWEPPFAGAYYLRLQVPQNGELDTYTSSKPLVTVSDADDLISITPASGEVSRGQTLRLSATLPQVSGAARYLWYYGTSAQGAFTAIDAEGAQISWNPDQTGEFYLRVRTLAETGAEKTYTSSKVLVSVRDSDAVFALEPNPANLVRGQSVRLHLNGLAGGRALNWFYAFSAQGPFQTIPGQGQDISWTPPLAGSFYLRAEASGGSEASATFTSASALVSVTESNQVIVAEPAGSQRMGSRIQLTAKPPETIANGVYTWSYGPTPVGPWSPVQSLDAERTGASVNWFPGQEGSWYLKTDVANPVSGAVLSFVSPRALVFVNNSRDFFKTNPNPANIGSQGAVELTVGFSPPAGETFTYAWSYAPAPTGPFTAVGASRNPSFTWLKPGTPGAYYIKLDAISNRSGQVLSFLSSEPLVFVGETQSQSNLRF